jgi:hypothetical protein
VLPLLVLEHYLDSSKPFLAFVDRRRVVAIERDVFQRIWLHAYGAFAAVVQPHQLHPSAMISPVQHKFDFAGPLPHVAVLEIPNLLHHICATPLIYFFMSCLSISGALVYLHTLILIASLWVHHDWDALVGAYKP